MRKIISIPPARIHRMESHHVIQAAKSTKADIDAVVEEQTHLNPEQRKDLAQLLCKFEKLFDGTLGHYPKRKFHINLKDDAVPFNCWQPYPCPAANPTCSRMNWTAKLRKEPWRRSMNPNGECLCLLSPRRMEPFTQSMTCAN